MIKVTTHVCTRRLNSAKHPRIFAPMLDAAVSAKSIAASAQRIRLCARFVFIFVLALAPVASFAARPAAAQSTPGPIAPRLGQDVQKPPSIRVRVNLVSTPAVVHNTQGELVLDLTQDNFRVSDNGVAQKIEGFELGAEQGHAFFPEKIALLDKLIINH